MLAVLGRCSSSSATSTASTRSSTSRSRSRRWRRTGTAASRATRAVRLARREGRDEPCSRSRSPSAGSLILTHDPDGLFPGLKSVPPADRPPLVPVFFAFRIMVGIGIIMIVAGLIGAWLWWRRPAVRDALVSVAGGARLVARLRRGDLGLDRHRERPPALARARHPAHRRRDLAGPRRQHARRRSRLFVLVYGVVFAMGIYYINRLINKGPQGARSSRPRPARRCGRCRPPSSRRREILSPQR